MLRIDSRDVDRLVRDLEKVRRKAIPHAVRNALNSQAFDARKRWQSKMGEEFTLRNKWVTGSVRVEKARGTNVRSMHSRVGSLFGPLAKQEDGGTKEGSGAPTEAAGGHSEGTAPRTKLVRPRFKKSLVQPTKRLRGSRGQRNVVAIKMARKAGSKFALIESQKGRLGVAQVMGGKRKPKLRFIWSMGLGGTAIKPKPTLGPVAEDVRRRGPSYYPKHLKYELRRAGFR